MDLQYSPHFSELFLAAYGSKGQGSKGKNIDRGNIEGDDSPGMVAVWSSAVPSRPEFRFTASSPVLTARLLLGLGL
jgi:hypothetical protein